MNKSKTYKYLVAGVVVLVMLNSYKQFYLPVIANAMNMKMAFLNKMADDAFYYLEIAKHIIYSGKSSFDGITETNGYHPLWFLILVALGNFIRIDCNLYFFAIVVVLPIICVSFGTFFLYLALRSGSEDKGAILLFVFPYYFYTGLPFSASGMESCLVLLFFPLLLLMLVRFTKETDHRRGMGLALAGSLLVLSRLDATILLAPILLFSMIIAIRKRNWQKVLVSFAAGLFPLFCYLIYNHIQFGNLMPVSGQAKALSTVPFFISGTALSSIMQMFIENRALQLQLLILIIAIAITVKNLITKRTIWQGMLLLILLLPAWYLPVIAMRSDWRLWKWYYSPLILSSSIGFTILANFLYTFLELSRTKTTYVLAGFFILLLGYLGWKTYRISDEYSKVNAILCAALKLEAFSQQHPGRYAMGDRAGLVGYLLAQPVVQLEGLACHNAMIDNISAQRNLLEVLTEYDVNYYIATNPDNRGETWYFEEPGQGGPYAPKMRMTLRTPPVFSFQCENVHTSVFELPDGGGIR